MTDRGALATVAVSVGLLAAGIAVWVKDELAGMRARRRDRRRGGYLRDDALLRFQAQEHDDYYAWRRDRRRGGFVR